MSMTEAATEAPAPESAGPARASTADDALAFLKAKGLELDSASGADDDADEAEDAGEEPARAESDGEGEAEGEDKPEEAAKDEDEQKAEGEDKPESRRESTHKRQKRKIEALQKRATELEGRDAEWQTVVNKVWADHEAWRTKAERLEAMLREAGYQPDPRDTHIEELERRDLARQVEEQTAAQRREQQLRRETQDRVRARVEQIHDEAEGLAERYAGQGVEVGALIRSYAALAEVDPSTSMEEVAQTLARAAAFKKQKPLHDDLRRQHTLNSQAPAAARRGGTSSSPPKYPATTDGALAFLKSRGITLD